MLLSVHCILSQLLIELLLWCSSLSRLFFLLSFLAPFCRLSARISARFSSSPWCPHIPACYHSCCSICLWLCVNSELYVLRQSSYTAVKTSVGQVLLMSVRIWVVTVLVGQRSADTRWSRQGSTDYCSTSETPRRLWTRACCPRCTGKPISTEQVN